VLIERRKREIRPIELWKTLGTNSRPRRRIIHRWNLNRSHCWGLWPRAGMGANSMAAANCTSGGTRGLQETLIVTAGQG